MRKVKIIQQIDAKVFKNRGPIGRWHIGVTNNPVGTRLSLMSEGRDVTRWQQWTAEDTLDAEAVNKLFVGLGMNKVESDGLTGTPSTVYVF